MRASVPRCATESTTEHCVRDVRFDSVSTPCESLCVYGLGGCDRRVSSEAAMLTGRYNSQL